jgi:predicted ATP-grasp superfamily ATP-dependent carboligase
MSVLVTDAAGNHALAVVRSLGQRDIRVAAADSVWCAKSFCSRYCAESATYPSPANGVLEFQNHLYRILEKVKPAILMPMTERMILALTADRKETESRVTLAPLSSQDALRVAFDKKLTVDLAKSLGIAVPRTFSFLHLPDFKKIRSQLSYPAVVKPRQSEILTVDNRIVPTGAVEYCMNPEELETKYLAVHQRSPRPLIQEFIPGEGYGISVLCRHGQIKALFAHRRLRMIRPTGSGSSLRESIAPPPAMVEATRLLLKTLEWHGVAMVEFKLDARDGIPKLMEINGRFWNSLPLAVAAGVDFPFLLYRLATEAEIPDCFEYRVGVKSRWLAGDIRHLVEVFRGKPKGWVDRFPSRWETLLGFMKFIGRDLYYDDLCLSDPVPFLADVGDLLFRQFPKFLFPRHAPAVEEMPHYAPAPIMRNGTSKLSSRPRSRRL